MEHNKASEPHYEYHPHGRNWVVYRYIRDATGSTGIKVGEYLTREEARSECYRLNGWKKKPQLNEKEKIDYGNYNS